MGEAKRTNEIVVSGPDGNEKSMDILEVARRQKMGCRSGHARVEITIWNGVETQ